MGSRWSCFAPNVFISLRIVVLSGDLLWRPLGLADVQDLAALLAVAEAAEQTGGEFRGAADLAEELADPAIEPGADTLAAYHGTDLVAYGKLVPQPGKSGPQPSAVSLVDVTLEGTVHPRLQGRGIGEHLVSWQTERGTRWLGEHYPGRPGELHVRVHESNQSKQELYERHGFTARRWQHDMVHDLEASPTGATITSDPAGLTLVPYASEYDARTHATYLTAMAGRVPPSASDDAYWHRWFTGNQKFLHGLSFLALSGSGDDETVVGYLLASEYQTDPAADLGRAALGRGIGVLPRWRGFGVGDALMRRFLAAARAAGYRFAVGSVDSANPTDMQGLVQRLGFTYARTVIRYFRPA